MAFTLHSGAVWCLKHTRIRMEVLAPASAVTAVRRSSAKWLTVQLLRVR